MKNHENAVILLALGAILILYWGRNADDPLPGMMSVSTELEKKQSLQRANRAQKDAAAALYAYNRAQAARVSAGGAQIFDPLAK